jgi:protein-disulfide isomerase
MELSVPVSAEDHIKGEKNAPVTLLEYGDFECPYCGSAYPVIKKVEELEGDNLRIVFRNFPLSEIHPHALKAAYAAEAAGKQGKFWQMHDLLFENQGRLGDEDLLGYARTLGLDIRQFQKDMVSKMTIEKVKNDFIGGAESGVNGTPTLYINGIRFDDPCEVDFLHDAIRRVVKK